MCMLMICFDTISTVISNEDRCAGMHALSHVHARSMPRMDESAGFDTRELYFKTRTNCQQIRMHLYLSRIFKQSAGLTVAMRYIYIYLAPPCVA